MEVTGECPDCGAELGLRIDTGLGALIGNKIEDMLEDDDNKVKCPAHGEWVTPENVEQVD